MRDSVTLFTGRRFRRLASGAILAWGVSPAPAVEGMAVGPPALGMAVAPPDPGMAGGGPASDSALPLPDARPEAGQDRRAVIAVLPPRRPRALGGVFPNEDGQLPNQRTGRHHEHVVHDICIGC